MNAWAVIAVIADGGDEGVRAVLAPLYGHVLRVFDSYAALGAGDPFCMHIVPWGQLMKHADIADESCSGCKMSDLDRVFLATNFEEDKSSEANQVRMSYCFIIIDTPPSPPMPLNASSMDPPLYAVFECVLCERGG
jgi:hypothetical protein